MLHLTLWPILAVFMGLGIVVFFVIVATIAWCTAHLFRDVVAGVEADVWCPVYRKQMRVRGTPRRFAAPTPFASLDRCERWGSGPIRCAKLCLEPLEQVSLARRQGGNRHPRTPSSIRE